MFSGDIIGVTYKPNGNTVVEIKTERGTRYTITMTRKDSAQIRWATFYSGEKL